MVEPQVLNLFLKEPDLITQNDIPSAYLVDVSDYEFTENGLSEWKRTIIAACIIPKCTNLSSKGHVFDGLLMYPIEINLTNEPFGPIN